MKRSSNTQYDNLKSKKNKSSFYIKSHAILNDKQQSAISNSDKKRELVKAIEDGENRMFNVLYNKNNTIFQKKNIIDSLIKNSNLQFLEKLYDIEKTHKINYDELFLYGVHESIQKDKLEIFKLFLKINSDLFDKIIYNNKNSLMLSIEYNSSKMIEYLLLNLFNIKKCTVCSLNCNCKLLENLANFTRDKLKSHNSNLFICY